MLIIYDGNVANQYLQEFAARYYQFGGIDSILVNVELTDARVPERFSLSQNYPNPFNPTTKIRYQLPNSMNVTLKVFDILGQEVATLVNERQNAGSYSLEFSPTNLARQTAGGLASGVYFYRLRAGDFIQQRKMLLLK